MLISQGPLRISLFGGGSDLPSYLAHNDGAVLSMAINKRVYIAGHPFSHRKGVLLKYSQTEDVSSPGELQHPIAREVLQRYEINDLDLAVMADVPAGTGLGSSSAFTVAFLALIRQLKNLPSTPVDLAREACEIEIDVLREPIGYQDQWASALGGVNVLRFHGTEVEVQRASLDAKTTAALEENLRLVPVGSPRRARSVLADQESSITPGSQEEILTSKLVGLVSDGYQALTSDLDELGPLLEQAWDLKKRIAPGASNAEVDAVHERGLASGATGGKLLGAGASGFLAFYVPMTQHDRFEAGMPQQLRIRISQEGAGVIHES